MESENSITLESCGEDSILIQTVKDMVEEDTHTELQNEEGFFVVTNVQDDQQNVIEVSNEESNEEANEEANEEPAEEPTISQSEERFIWSNLCRVCANSNDHIIPIFEGEGLQHNLCNKIHKYLPIQVSKNDTLPLQLCYHCAATLLAWHELLEGCLNAERRLLEMQNALQEKQNLERLDASTQDTSISNVSESLHQQQETIQDGVCEESTVSDSDRWKIESDGVIRIPTVGSERTNAEEEGYIQCAQCDIIFADMKYFIDHMNTTHQAQMYYCQYCKFMYNGQKRDFEEHISMHNSDYEESKNVTECKPLGCVNGIKKENDRSVTSRFVTDTEQFANYTCHLCEKNFLKKSELKKHINKHSNVSRIQNPDEMELVNKAKQVINDRVSYKCDTCKKVIFTKRGFLRHIRVHSDKRPCKCDLCGKFYRIEQDLARHVRDVHEGLKKYVCDICGRAFANKGAKDDHRRIHTGERPYACEHCPKMFRTLNSIYIHNRVHTDYKPHKCSYCGKHFRSRQRLTHHETTHTGIKAFACEICGRTFSVKGEVVRHRAVHNEEKPFDCKCGMKFGQKRYLRNHIKQHHKEASSWLLAELSGNN